MPNSKPDFVPKNEREKDPAAYAQAAARLADELAKGRRSAETDGWLSLEAVEKHLRRK